VPGLPYWKILLQVSNEAEMSDAMLWNELGNIYRKIGSPKDAIVAYTKAIELDPNSGWPYCNLGAVYFLGGEFGHALFLFRKSIQYMDTPENQAMVWNNIGDAYRALKDIDNAISAYKKADDLDMRASFSEQESGRLREFPAILREVLKSEKLVPKPDQLLSVPLNTSQAREPSLGSRDLDDGFQPASARKVGSETNPPTIQSEIIKPISSNTNWIADHDISALKISNQQDTAFLANESEQAPRPIEKPSDILPDSKEKIEQLLIEGSSQFEPEQFQNSEKAGRQVGNQSEKSKGHSNINPGIDNLEEILAKVNIYENITRVNPTSDRAWDTLGKLYKSLGRYKDAIGAYQKAIELSPDREVYYYYLGLLFSVEQQHDEAVQAFQFVLHKNPDYVLAHSALAGVYHRMGLENKANHHIATALPKMNNESAYNRACFYAICGDIELAFEFLRLALMNKDTTIEWIKSDPDLDPIRSDQRFQELIFEKDQHAPENTNENYFSSELDGMHNRLLPILNHSLAR
jgi:tetratricopeptide (TPR) repeat protein